MRKTEYDFLTWTSFPSSLKIINDEPRWLFYPCDVVQVDPTLPYSCTVKVKQLNVRKVREDLWGSGIRIMVWDGKEWKSRGGVEFPPGTWDWSIFTFKIKEPIGAKVLRAEPYGAIGTTWFDDLQIWQNDKLIYDNYFTALRPGKVVPVIWTPPERIIGAVQRWKQGEKALIFKPPRLLQTVKI